MQHASFHWYKGIIIPGNIVVWPKRLNVCYLYHDVMLFNFIGRLFRMCDNG